MEKARVLRIDSCRGLSCLRPPLKAGRAVFDGCAVSCHHMPGRSTYRGLTLTGRRSSLRGMACAASVAPPGVRGPSDEEHAAYGVGSRVTRHPHRSAVEQLQVAI